MIERCGNLAHLIESVFEVRRAALAIEGSMMRLSRPRFTIRRIMILVAIVGVALGGTILAARLKRRAELFQTQATFFGSLEKFYQRSRDLHLKSLESALEFQKKTAELMRETEQIRPGASDLIDQLKSELGIKDDRAESLEETIELERKQISYFSLMRRKYQRAASRPWEPVTPDPPLPVGPRN